MIRRWWHRLMGLLVPRPKVQKVAYVSETIAKKLSDIAKPMPTVVRVPDRSYWINERGVFVKEPTEDPIAPTMWNRIGGP